jgi:hypothetical protein
MENFVAKRDLFNNIEVAAVAVPLAAHAASIALASAVTIDTYGYYGIVFFANVGVVTDSTHLLTLYESDTDVTANYTAVAATDVLGGLFPANLTTLTNIKMGYVGARRYLRVTLTWTTSGAGTGGVYGVGVIFGYPLHKPAVNP